eukprot:7315554-Alexandrium_andersonii.AAC.1
MCIRDSPPAARGDVPQDDLELDSSPPSRIVSSSPLAWLSDEDVIALEGLANTSRDREAHAHARKHASTDRG